MKQQRITIKNRVKKKMYHTRYDRKPTETQVDL